MKQDMCPICTAPFKEGEAVIQFGAWSEKTMAKESTRLGHVDCVLYISRKESRKHPPPDACGSSVTVG